MGPPSIFDKKNLRFVPFQMVSAFYHMAYFVVISKKNNICKYQILNQKVILYKTETALIFI